ncbi:adenylate/guanylate cyclase domain-containing protein [Microvirga lotononidis]|uniref:Family 3 adenylate cyclase n=1 Tax=Microvirga lotononidis TaxID=864069 RepID=I4YKZ7_9HYPH|nr:adenylate/guanylate cyclase domain-containing protein [Microvirga lotononidis]EIM24639.1 family 3 adenylate cyclase [Microvirga lotononidis]WQO26653.1 adenylate/guanylate cyclase domain-containing protein [Microvirga lotononidis]
MRVRIGYQPSITALFVAVVLAVGLSLVFLSFERARAITRSAALSFIDRVADQTTDRVDGQFKDVLDILAVLRQLKPVETGAVQDNPELTAILAALLRQHEQLYNLYVGYADGALVELDLIDRAGPGLRAQLKPPAGAVFRLTVIDTPKDGGPRRRFTSYLSSGLEILSQEEREADYDPRVRPWYQDAFKPDAGAVTEPYVFDIANLIGYTVRAPFTRGRGGIAAGDILLNDAEAFLRSQKLGQSGVVFLFDDSGTVVAHPRMSEFLSTQGANAPLDLPPLDRMLNVDISRPLDAWQRGGSPQQIFDDAHGRTYVAAFRPIKSSGSSGLRLAVVAPLDEFFAEIEESRQNLVLLALGFVLASLPVIGGIGLLLSRSMKALAAETDRIQRFDTNGPARDVRSIIREIDDLGRSVSTMRTVVRTFAAFVPKRLVQQLVATGDALRLGGSRRVVTILFTDIAGFTHITEKADPEQVMLQTSRYLAALSAVIMEHGGTVDKFVGDAVMAIWNAPADDPDHVANACAAALACREANRALNEEFEKEGWPAYRTRYGLHTGEAVVGTIGSADRMAYTVLGAAVNLAARLEPLNKDYGTEILVSDAVREHVADRFAFRMVDTIQPKGFEAKVRVYELCGALEERAEARLEDGQG